MVNDDTPSEKHTIPHQPNTPAPTPGCPTSFQQRPVGRLEKKKIQCLGSLPLVSWQQQQGQKAYNGVQGPNGGYGQQRSPPRRYPPPGKTGSQACRVFPPSLRRRLEKAQPHFGRFLPVQIRPTLRCYRQRGTSTPLAPMGDPFFGRPWRRRGLRTSAQTPTDRKFHPTATAVAAAAWEGGKDRRHYTADTHRRRYCRPRVCVRTHARARASATPLSEV